MEIPQGQRELHFSVAAGPGDWKKLPAYLMRNLLMYSFYRLKQKCLADDPSQGCSLAFLRFGPTASAEEANKGRMMSHNEKRSYQQFPVYRVSAARNPTELRCARWWQVNFAKREFQVGRTKTPTGDGRIIPLNQTAMDAFTAWRTRWPDAKPSDFIFPSEKLFFKGKGSAKLGLMTSHELDLSRPLGSWKTAWRRPRSGLALSVGCTTFGTISSPTLPRPRRRTQQFFPSLAT